MPDSSSPTEHVTVDLELELIEGIEAFAAESDPSPLPQEAVRMIIRDWLMSYGGNWVMKV